MHSQIVFFLQIFLHIDTKNVPFQFQGSLNSSASVDPDFDNTEGMNFVWYCKDIDDAEFNQANLNKEPVISNSDVVGSPNASANLVSHGWLIENT